jgi:T5SS/PEP-CTERM-associated repeat protein
METRKVDMKTTQIILTATLLFAPTLCAQIVADGATVTLSNVTNTIPGTVTVGTNGSFTLLTLSDNALLTNSANGVIGLNLTARSNEVQLISASARWRMGGSLFVGSNGVANRLVVSNGAFVENGVGNLGNRVDSSNNFAMVTGGGSMWSNRLDLRVGTGGSGNQLIVSNGGWVASRSGFVGNNVTSSKNFALVTGSGSVWSNTSTLEAGLSGSGNRLVIEAGGLAHGDAGTVGHFTIASDNEVMVTGPGSLWTNRSFLTVGNQGGFNRLVVSNGAAAWSGNGLIGNITTATNNQVLVTGAGSEWRNQNDLTVGNFSPGNRLVVSNGGTVSASNLFIGFTSFSTNNRVTVDGGTLRVTNAAGTAVLDVRRGTNVLNAGLVQVDQLLLTNAAGKLEFNGGLVDADMLVAFGNGHFEFNGGKLITRGAKIGLNLEPYFYIGTAAGSEPAVWDVRPGASNTVFSSGAANIGSTSSFNHMLNTNGALITGGFAVLGEYPGAHSNSLVLSGVGSKWLQTGCSLGATGACNRVVVSDGAEFSGSRLFVSFDRASTNNEVVVTGVGSTWNNSQGLRLGFIGGGNRLVISNGGRLVNADDAFVGYSLSSSNNEMLVTGIGSVCSNQLDLHVGESGSGNRLVITNGGRVESQSGLIGQSLSSSNNEAIVTGPGSEWSNRDSLDVGASAGNRLVVRDGATVSAGNLISLGDSSGSNNGRILVDGGTLRAINGLLNVRGGTNVLNAGLVDVDSLMVTNSAGVFEFNGGTLITRFGIISNGANFVVGDTGTVPAVWNILGGSRFFNAILPGNFQITNGTYRPTNHDVNDVLSAPAPAGPYDNSLAMFIGTMANGPWSLFIMDDLASDTGSLGSWSLQIQTTTGALTNVMSGSILIPSNAPAATSGRASPYPSVLAVTGLGGTITNLTVTLSGLSHTFPDDLDILLVGPGGQKVMLMSDAGGGFALGNATLVFDDAAILEAMPTTTMVSSTLIIGRNVAGCQLLVTNSEAALQAGGVVVGLNPASTDNRIVIGGGTLRVTNASGTATFDVRRGTNVFNSGLMDVDNLLLTSSEGYFEFNGGTLITRSTTDSNGRVFTVGNSASAATLRLAGGTHIFFNNLDVANNASLVGNGNIVGTLTVKPGGILAPSNTPSTFGTLSLSQPPVLQGATHLRIYRSESFLTNDQIQTTLTLNYSGSITVTQLPAVLVGTLTLGDRFQLFSAGAYAGSFSALTLPPLNSGLEWTNKLMVDGSIEVVAAPPKFAGITVSGTNVILTGTNGTPNAPYAVLTATNLALPLSNWTSIATNQFGPSGNFSFTNGISFGVPQRFFRIRTL